MKAVSMSTVLTLDVFSPMELASLALDRFGDKIVNFPAATITVQNVIKKRECIAANVNLEAGDLNVKILVKRETARGINVTKLQGTVYLVLKTTGDAIAL